MKNRFLCIAFLASFLSCYSNVVGPTNGYLYTKIEYPGAFNPFYETEPTKQARGCIKNYLGILSLGEAGAGDIAFANKIEKITHIDYSITSYFGFVYSEYCTTVYGN